jgi:hypothetical protein
VLTAVDAFFAAQPACEAENEAEQLLAAGV